MIYEKLRKEVEDFTVFTPSLIEKIDEIIDSATPEHDLGRGADPLSFHRLTYELWLEFGDVYIGGKPLHLRSRRERLEWLQRHHPNFPPNALLYIPDDALILATLHHVLDLCMDFLLNNPVSMEDSHLMLTYARARLRDYELRLRSLYEHGLPSLVDLSKAYDWLFQVLMERSKQLYQILAEELRRKGLKPGHGPRRILELLKNKSTRGVVRVNGQPLPLAAAARKLFNELRKHKKTTLEFDDVRIEAESLNELLEQLLRHPGSCRDIV